MLPSDAWRSHEPGSPVLRILLILAVSVGLPYLLLASTSPLLQAAYTRLTGGAPPYRLFALSNLASLLALLSYPVVVEPALTLRVQAAIWSGLYAIYIALTAAALWPLSHAKATPREDVVAASGPAAIRLAALDRLPRGSFDASARVHQLPVREHRRGPVPLGRALERLSPDLHPLLRPAPVVPPAIFLPLAAAGLLGLSFLFLNAGLRD